MGQTGARFGSAAARRRRQAARAEYEQTLAAAGPAQPPVEPAGRPAQASSSADRSPRLPESGPDLPEPGPDRTLSLDQTRSLVRPYAWTGGRTVARYDLRLETLVSTAGAAAATGLPATGAEHRLIIQVCAVPRSVAEVAAALSVPVGVARVLLGDLIALGALAVHETQAAAEGTPDLDLLGRVLAGLQRL